MMVSSHNTLLSPYILFLLHPWIILLAFSFVHALSTKQILPSVTQFNIRLT